MAGQGGRLPGKVLPLLVILCASEASVSHGCERRRVPMPTDAPLPGRDLAVAGRHPRLLAWWEDDLADPDRPTLRDPAVQRLVAAVSPGAQATDLGGAMSLNARLDPAGLVLRVHQSFVSRRRLLAVQEVRRALANLGLRVP